ncbi:hypothetical protein [Microbacterium sp. P02]|uniref:hypothetical protein n=1 Tax=Microbacterium sp. P02 TaxID=3366260 RepID=UPI0036700017
MSNSGRQLRLRRWAAALWVLSGAASVVWLVLLLTTTPPGLGLWAASASVCSLVGFALWRMSDPAYGGGDDVNQVEAEGPHGPNGSWSSDGRD